MILKFNKIDKEIVLLDYYKMKLYQKITLFSVILGLVILVPIVVSYFFINSFVGIPFLGLVLGGFILHIVILIVINIACFYTAFFLKNRKIVGGLLIALGLSFLLFGSYFGIPSMILFIISGVLALKENRSLGAIKNRT